MTDLTTDNVFLLVILQSYFSYMGDIQMSGAMVAGIIDYKNKKAPGEIRTSKEIFDDFTSNYEEYDRKLGLLAINNGRIVNGVLQISQTTINT